MHKLHLTARDGRCRFAASLFIASDGTTSATQIIVRAVAMRINAPSLTMQDTHEHSGRVPSASITLSQVMQWNWGSLRRTFKSGKLTGGSFIYAWTMLEKKSFRYPSYSKWPFPVWPERTNREWYNMRATWSPKVCLAGQAFNSCPSLRRPR